MLSEVLRNATRRNPEEQARLTTILATGTGLDRWSQRAKSIFVGAWAMPTKDRTARDASGRLRAIDPQETLAAKFCCDAQHRRIQRCGSMSSLA
jgi:hypothetical protein